MSAITREEQYLAYLNGTGTSFPKPITRVEQYLYALCVKGGVGSGVTDEQIKSAVDAYLAENPVQGGATTEQAEQIEKNREDIENLNNKKVSWNDLNDRPFGEVNSVLYEWDGNTEGLEYLDMGMIVDGVSGNILYKVSDTPISYENLIGGVAYLNNLDHTSFGTGIITEDLATVEGNLIFVNNGIIIIALEDTEDASGAVLTKGIWHLNPNDAGIYVAKAVQTTVTQLDSKYLPKDTITEWIDEYISDALGGDY